MNRLSKEHLAAATGATPLIVGRWIAALAETFDRFEINTPRRQAAFLAQIGHETGGLTHLVENLNYSEAGLMKTWPGRFADPVLAKRYARKPEAIANRVYANRMGNGDEASGDGWKFRGRGLIQLTGKANYTAFAHAMGLPVLSDPDLLATSPIVGALAAGWFWDKNGLNRLADELKFEFITRKINGGLHGQPQRLALYSQALEVLA